MSFLRVISSQHRSVYTYPMKWFDRRKCYFSRPLGTPWQAGKPSRLQQGPAYSGLIDLVKKWNFPMAWSVRRSFGRLVGLSKFSKSLTSMLLSEHLIYSRFSARMWMYIYPTALDHQLYSLIYDVTLGHLLLHKVGSNCLCNNTKVLQVFCPT